jgi:hypothetical protein
MLVWAIVALFASVLSADQKPAGTKAPKPTDAVVRVDSSSPVRVCGDCSPRDIRFSVTVLTDPPIKLQAGEDPQIMEVSRSGAREMRAERAITAKWNRADDGTPRAIVLTVGSDLREQGTYTVLLDATPKQHPLAPRISLQIVIPAAKLLVPTKLVVERTTRFGGVMTRPESFEFRETGRQSGIQTLSFSTYDLVAPEDVTGRVLVDLVGPGLNCAEATQTPQHVAAQPHAVCADKAANASIKLAGDFPLGTASGQLRLSAPELADTVSIPLEIKSRLSLQFLFLAIVLGITLSWWVKVVLHGIIERNTARANAASLLQRVYSDVAAFQDETFEKAVVDEIADLENKRKSSDVAAIDQARTALDKAWRDALQDLDRRRLDFGVQAAAFKELLTRAWVLAAPLMARLVEANAGLAAANDLQVKGNVAGGTARLLDVRTTLAKQLHEEGRTWQQQSRAFVDSVVGHLQGPFATISVALKAAVDNARAELPVFDNVPTRVDPSTIESLLQRLHREYRHATEVSATAESRLESAFTTASANPATPDQWKSVRDELDALKGVLSRGADEPEKATSDVAAGLDRLRKTWEQALAQAGVAGGGVLLGSGAQPPIDAVVLATASMPGRAAFAIVMGDSTSGGRLAAEIQDAESRVWWAKLQQSLIVGLLFVVWAFSTYSATFNGTLAGLTTVFFSAFSVDVAVDSLLTKMKR